MKTLLLWLLLLPGTAWASRTLTDELGYPVNVPDHPHRVICLVPSITDTVFALGAANDVAAVSDFVRYPTEATKKPSVGSMLTPSLETILALYPDLVLATPKFTQQSALDQIERMGIPVYLVEPHGLSGVLGSVTDIGHALNRDAQAAALVARLQQRIDAVKAHVHNLPVITVFMPISYDPPITIGKGAYITEIIAAAGGRSITDDLPQEWAHVSMEAVIARAPEALLMYADSKFTVATLAQRPGWGVLPAIRNHRVYTVDQRIDLPSPSAIDALEDLARQFHP
jgi:ABC-type Fe3+-hydroxamate transport system substrate-binding protein